MIYFTTTDGKAYLVIEKGNLDLLRIGKPMSSPDGKFMVCYTPDLLRLAPIVRKLCEEPSGFDAEKFEAILKESLTWKEA